MKRKILLVRIDGDVRHPIDWFDTIEQAKQRIRYIKADRKKEIAYRKRTNNFFGSAAEENKELTFKIEVHV